MSVTFASYFCKLRLQVTLQGACRPPKPFHQAGAVDTFGDQVIKRERALSGEAGDELLLRVMIGDHQLLADRAPLLVETDPLTHRRRVTLQHLGVKSHDLAPPIADGVCVCLDNELNEMNKNQ